MRVIVVDDSPLDREMICETLKEIDEAISVSEAENIEIMFKRLKKPCDLLLLDISLDISDPTNSAGLDALHELMGEYPDVPIAIVTGHFEDKVREFLSYLGTSKQLIDYIDKSLLNEERLHQSIEKAVTYRKAYRDSRAVEDRSTYYFQAFTGENWKERVTAEAWIAEDGSCNINGMLIWIAIEDSVRRLSNSFSGEKASVSSLITYLKQSRKIDASLADKLFRSKFIRDHFVHHRQSICKTDAQFMTDCLDELPVAT